MRYSSPTATAAPRGGKSLAQSSREECLQPVGDGPDAQLVGNVAATLAQTRGELFVAEELDQLFAEFDRVLLRREERVVVALVEGEVRRDRRHHRCQPRRQRLRRRQPEPPLGAVRRA